MTIIISSYEKYLHGNKEFEDRWIQRDGEVALKNIEISKKNHNELRNRQLERFSYTVVLEGPVFYFDYLNRWCWQNFGYQQCDQCYEYCSDFPGCFLSNELNRELIDGIYRSGDHGHIGNWGFFFFRKTGYDYGICEYYLKLEKDRDNLLAVIPIVNSSEF